MAANRFYLSSRATCAVSPAFSSGWDNTASAVRRSMKGYRSNYEMLSKAVGGQWAAGDDVLVAQFVSPPLSGAYSWTAADKVRGILRSLESAVGADMRAQLRVRLVKQDGTDYASPKVLLELDGGALASEFDAATLTNRKFPLNYAAGGAVLTAQTQADGDRLVVEVGFRCHGGDGSTVYTGTLRFGDGQSKSSDLAEDETSTADNCAWVEFTTGTALAGKDMGATGVSVLGGKLRISYANWGSAGVNVDEAVTSAGSPHFYIDSVNGVDSSGQSGAIGAPWKTLAYAINTRLAAGGLNDRNDQGCFIELRTNAAHGTEAGPLTYNLGSSTIGSKNIGGSASDPWTVRPYPGDGGTAIIQARVYYNTGMRFFRWENCKWDGSNAAVAGGLIDCQGGRDVWHFDCEITGSGQSLSQCVGDSRATLQKASNIWFVRCKHHDGGTDTTGAPHHHCWYWGSGGGGGDVDSDPAAGQGPNGGAISCIGYKATGSGHQFYENAEGVLVLNNTIDECCYPAAVDFTGAIIAGGTSGIGRFARHNKVVNSGLTTIDGGGGTDKWGLYAEANGPVLGRNIGHHNGYFANRTGNEKTGITNVWDYQGSNQTTDPQFTNRAARDYHIPLASPWAGAGDSAFAPGKDFFGNTFSRTDIGAVASPVSADALARTEADSSAAQVLASSA